MNKVKYGLLFVVCILLMIWGFSSIGKTIFIKYTGKKVTALVEEVPLACDKYNHIKVLLDSVDYEVNISRGDCRDGVYKIGQKVELLKHNNYQELVWPESQPELVVLLIIAVLIFGLFSAKKYVRK